jgi:hypothetical protein
LRVSAAILYQFQVLPVGVFGKVRSFVVVEPPTRDCIAALSETCGSSLFFFVAEAPEVRRILRENIKVVDTSADSAWESIFDDADQNVLESKE